VENAAKQAISSDASKQETMPSGFRTIAPYIIVPRAGEFIEFLVKAFAGTELFRVPIEGSNLIMHAEVGIGNSVIELADANEQILPAPTAIHLYVEDARASFKRAIDAGATSIYEVGEHVSGDTQGAVRDPFGNVWYIAMKGDWTPGPGELVPSVQPYLHLLGSEKMIPFLENAFGGVVQGHVPMSPDGARAARYPADWRKHTRDRRGAWRVSANAVPYALAREGCGCDICAGDAGGSYFD